MKFTEKLSLGTLTLLAAVTACSIGHAQQVTGTPGSPSATTTIEGNQLPAPPRKFGGVIEESAKDSRALVAAARGAAQGRAQYSADHD